MYLLVGLGNPGTKYYYNRHNIGYMVIDHLAKNYELPSFKKKTKSVEIADLKAAIIGPSGYTGHEIIRILLKHPKVKIKQLIGNKSEGKYISDIFSTLSHIDLPRIKNLKNANFSNIDIPMPLFSTTKRQLPYSPPAEYNI